MKSDSLAVKYRPRTLDNLVGQDSVVTQMQGMLKSKKIHSTMLFAGSHGAGKTTSARMLARYINCAKLNSDGNPCGKCDSCSYKENHPDIHELNMADTRGIEDVRNLINASRNLPSVGKKRIFIIDECFVSDTLVEVDYGSYIPILDVVENSAITEVVSYNSLTKTVEKKKILRKMVKKVKLTDMVKVSLSDGSYELCTKNHKWWSETKQSMLYYFRMIGDNLLSHDNQILDNTLTVSSGDRVNRFWNGHMRNKYFRKYQNAEDKSAETVTVYDIEVEDNHNFFILPKNGTKNVLVSNCHQMTAQAAQAFLVPLEKPPAHTVWMLATTNPEKLPNAVLSRCFRFNIRPIPEEAIAKRLYRIAKKEGVDFKEIKDGVKVLQEISVLSSGHMRDAIQMLESVLFAIYSKKKFTASELITNFARSTDADLDMAAVKLVLAVLKFDIKAALKIVIEVNNCRGLISKSRWLVQSLISKGLGTKYFQSYAMREFTELNKKEKVSIKIGLLIKLQKLMCEIEYKFNTMSIDEVVQMTSSLGQFLMEEKA